MASRLSIRISLILLYTYFLALSVSAFYCSSTCIDYTDTCYDKTTTGCWVCANHIFNMVAHTNGSCILANQTSIVANELADPTMDLTGYASSTLTPYTCSSYVFSGQYAANDFLTKNFTGIPLNHYALVIRFSVGYIGAWTDTDYLRLKLDDATQTVNYDYRYSCDRPSTLCGGGNNTDCIRIK